LAGDRSQTKFRRIAPGGFEILKLHPDCGVCLGADHPAIFGDDRASLANTGHGSAVIFQGCMIGLGQDPAPDQVGSNPFPFSLAILR
jgi:hypothetical protein